MMKLRINSPLLMPFGHDVELIKKISKMDKLIYIYPIYSFVKDSTLLEVNNKPTRNMLDYVRGEIEDHYTGIIKKSKYYYVFRSVFKKETAEFLDKIYRIELDKSGKQTLEYILLKYFHKYMDSIGFSKIILSKPILLGLLEKENIKNGISPCDIRVTENIINAKFATICDSIYRYFDYYTPNFLGVMKLFHYGDVKTTPISWRERLSEVVDKNLMHGGLCILDKYPREIEEKLNKFFKERNFEKIEKNIWEKPDLNVKKISKGIRKWMK